MKKEIDAEYMIKSLGLEKKPKLNLYVVMQRIIGVAMLLLYILQIATLIIFVMTFICWLLNITDDYWADYIKQMKKFLYVA
tara:strand:- start:179 stop:421 length:243 start_codon:yes stop_codon:yes gene_type:complete